MECVVRTIVTGSVDVDAAVAGGGAAAGGGDDSDGGADAAIVAVAVVVAAVAAPGDNVLPAPAGGSPSAVFVWADIEAMASHI